MNEFIKHSYEDPRSSREVAEECVASLRDGIDLPVVRIPLQMDRLEEFFPLVPDSDVTALYDALHANQVNAKKYLQRLLGLIRTTDTPVNDISSPEHDDLADTASHVDIGARVRHLYLPSLGIRLRDYRYQEMQPTTQNTRLHTMLVSGEDGTSPNFSMQYGFHNSIRPDSMIISDLHTRKQAFGISSSIHQGFSASVDLLDSSYPRVIFLQGTFATSRTPSKETRLDQSIFYALDTILQQINQGMTLLG